MYWSGWVVISKSVITKLNTHLGRDPFCRVLMQLAWSPDRAQWCCHGCGKAPASLACHYHKSLSTTTACTQTECQTNPALRSILIKNPKACSCLYLWPGAKPPLSRAQVAIAVSAGFWALIAAVTTADGFVLVVAQRLDAAYRACLSARLPTRLTAFTPLSSHPAKYIKSSTQSQFIQKNMMQNCHVWCKIQQYYNDIYWT